MLKSSVYRVSSIGYGELSLKMSVLQERKVITIHFILLSTFSFTKIQQPTTHNQPPNKMKVQIARDENSINKCFDVMKTLRPKLEQEQEKFYEVISGLMKNGYNLIYIEENGKSVCTRSHFSTRERKKMRPGSSGFWL